jgi:hypothetical protein
MGQTMDMKRDSRRGVKMHSHPAIVSSNTAVRAEDPVMREGYRNVQGLARRLRQRPLATFAVRATHANADHSWEEFNER